MAKPTPRRLTMADLAILTAGVALPMGVLKMMQEASPLANFGSERIPWILVDLGIGYFSIGLALGLIVARAIRPRPRWRAVFRQPGTLACLVILAHLLVIVLVWSWQSFTPSRHSLSPYRIDFNSHRNGNKFGGGWVAVAWTTLALARAWRPEPSWIDRSGRILGVVVILHWLRWAVFL